MNICHHRNELCKLFENDKEDIETNLKNINFYLFHQTVTFKVVQFFTKASLNIK